MNLNKVWLGKENAHLIDDFIDAYEDDGVRDEMDTRYPGIWKRTALEDQLYMRLCDLTGAGTVTLGVTALTNGVKFIANPTLEGEATVDLDAVGGITNGVKFIWNAAADLPAGFKAGGVQVKVTAEQ